MDEPLAQTEAAKPLPIEELFRKARNTRSGSKDPMGTKGARVTSYVTLPGRYCVLMPNVEHVAYPGESRKEETREQLKAIASELKPAGFGIIMRTASEDASAEEIRRDLEFLLLVWRTSSERKIR